MRDHSVTRRKFFATSTSVAVGAAALGIAPTTLAKSHLSEKTDPDDTFATLEQIAPSGIIQDRLSGKDAKSIAIIPLQLKQAENVMLAGGSGLSTVEAHEYATTAVYQKVNTLSDRRISGLAEDGLRYTDYLFDYKIEGVWAERNTATVVWTEQTIFNIAGDPDPQAPQQSSEVQTHMTLLRRIDNVWKIERDTPWVSHSTPSLIGEEQVVLEDAATTDQRKRTSQNKLLNEVSKSENFGTDFANIMATYSREAATAYALARGDKSDENGYHDFGNNCTNFISQCLKAGGWPDVAGYYKSTDAWWHHGDWPTYAAYPWHNAHYWYHFTQNTGRGERIYNIWDMWFGDILEYDWNNDGYMDHAAIVSFRSNAGVIYMAQHTINYSKKPLADIVAVQEPDWRYYPWRMKTSF